MLGAFTCTFDITISFFLVSLFPCFLEFEFDFELSTWIDLRTTLIWNAICQCIRFFWVLSFGYLIRIWCLSALRDASLEFLIFQ